MNIKSLLAALAAIPISQCLWVAPSYAVGSGEDFMVTEYQSTLVADSMDFTYHACTQIDAANGLLDEWGYFWISSYQTSAQGNNGDVVDSQLNYSSPGLFDNNGYNIYGKYQYQAQRVLAAQPTVTGIRLSYDVAEPATLSLHVDPNRDTQLFLNQNCQQVIVGAADDYQIIDAVGVEQGEKYEENGLSNGHFKLVFYAQNTLVNHDGPVQLDLPNTARHLVFNGNLTELGGPLNNRHRPEGSGNLFWKAGFNPFPQNDAVD